MATESKTTLFISKMVKEDGDLKDRSVYARHLTSGGPFTIYNFVIENRTSDPISPVTGQIWIRTDL